MSLRYEQYKSLLHTKQFLDKILRLKYKECKLRELKDEAYHCLKHYPFLKKQTGEPMFSRDEFTEDTLTNNMKIKQELLDYLQNNSECNKDYLIDKIKKLQY